MTTIHFAGLNGALFAAATEGRPVLISYADIVRRPGVWERELKPRLEAGAYSSVILDSGAFTVKSTEGFRIDIEAYAAFALEHEHLFDMIVNLDDIDGDLETTWRNQAILEAEGLTVLPVYHQDEPIEVLAHYVLKYRTVGLGFARREKGLLKYGRNVNRAWLEAVFRRIGGRSRTHGFAMTSWVGEFPFDTVDSTTWIAEYRGLRKREPELERATATHGTAGPLAEILLRATVRELVDIVLASYDAVAEGTHRLADYARGQARTVCRRFGAALGRVLRALISNAQARLTEPVLAGPAGTVTDVCLSCGMRRDRHDPDCNVGAFLAADSPHWQPLGVE